MAEQRRPKAQSHGQDFRLISVATGEVAPVVLTFTPVAVAGSGAFVKFFQDAQTQMLEDHPELSGDAFRLLFWLVGAVQWGNGIPGPAAAAKKTGWLLRSVKRWYAALKAAGFVIREDGAWYLNPLICWKGRPADYQEAVRELVYAPSQRAKALAASAATSPAIEGVVVRDGDAPQ